MNSIKEKFKKISSHVKHLFISSSYNVPGIRPERDWIVILSSFAVCIVAIGVFALYINIHVQEGAFWKTESDNQVLSVHTINQKNLDTFFGVLSQKEKTRNEVVSGSIKISDPSL